MTRVKIGLPRAIQFYQHYPLWRTFFEALGAETVVSPPTNRDILTAGSSVVADVTCLPLKVYAGHLCWLRDHAGVDFVFSPAIWNLEKDAFHCTKLKCLPDIMEATVPKCPPLLVAEVDPDHRRLHTDAAFHRVGSVLSGNPLKVRRAWADARQVDEGYRGLTVKQGLTYPEALGALYGSEWLPTAKPGRKNGRLTVGLVGHPYCLYDDYINHNLIGCLRESGVDVLTSEMVPPEAAEFGVRLTTRQVRWFYEYSMSGAAGHFLLDPQVHGIIAAFAFGCGPDSTMLDTIARRARACRRPYLGLVLDEHGSATGMLTRLEAFVDMLARTQGAALSPPPTQKLSHAGLSEPSPPARSVQSDHPIIGIPSMGAATVAVKSLFDGIGARVELGPAASRRTWDLGARSAPEFMCTPYKQILGNMIEMLDAGANTLVYIDAVDQCRTGSYHQLMEDALHDLGYNFEFLIWSDLFEGGIFGMPRFLRRFAPGLTWRTVVREVSLGLAKLRAIDDVERRVQYRRPRELTPGAVDEIWKGALKRFDEARSLAALKGVKTGIFQQIDQVPCDPLKRPVRVGLTGEMFASLDPFYNQDLERQLSRAGAEVHRTLMLSNWLRAEMILGILGLPHGRDLQRATRQYMRTNVAGPTIGDTVVCAQHGFDGMVEVLPFTCMPHITALNVLPRVARDYDIPVLTFIFDEQTAGAGMQARIEAFVDLLYRRREMREASRLPAPRPGLPRSVSCGPTACAACPAAESCLEARPAAYACRPGLDRPVARDQVMP